ncbi:MAG TPA: hypothetical protein VFQ96_01760, partial [Microbacteriaceae bacterium]|nr:hypothetical protein [Microbacteriaceae bacterium]
MAAADEVGPSRLLLEHIELDGDVEEGTGLVLDAEALFFGEEFVTEPPPLPFATDFGNISHLVPAALIGVGRPGGWGFHTARGAAEFSSPDALRSALTIARVLALS